MVTYGGKIVNIDSRTINSVSVAGWKALFTRIVASNEEIKRGIGFFLSMSMFFFVVPQASLRLKIHF